MHLSSRKKLPLFRSINGLAVLTRYAAIQGVDLSLLIKGGGIKISDLDDPDFLVTPDQELIVINNIIKLMPEPGLGLSIGGQYHNGVLGKIGAAAINSSTFGEALEIFFQFDELLLTYFHFDISIKKDLVYFLAREKIDLKEARLFVSEREFASMHRVTSDLLGNPVPFKKIHFAYAEPEYALMYQDLFQCPLVFNAEKHMVVFDKDVLFRQLPMANPLSKKTYVKECRELVCRIQKKGTVSKKVIQEIKFHRNEYPDFDKLASYLNMSPRTLRRRLTDEGTSYKELVSEIQKNKAIKLIRTTSLTIEQIAYEVGFSEVPNFYRAFKRWTGSTPGSYRSENLQYIESDSPFP